MGAPDEIWKKINDRYSVSSFGRVKSNDIESIDSRGRKRFKKGKILSTKGTRNGYPVVNVSGLSTKRNFKVHRLVATAFLPNPYNLPVVNHINGDITDNRIENLEWCTQQHNSKHAYLLGRKPVKNYGVNNSMSKKVLNMETGKVYNSLGELVRLESVKYSYTALRAMLSGQNNNKTSFKYI